MFSYKLSRMPSLKKYNNNVPNARIYVPSARNTLSELMKKKKKKM